MKLERVSLLFFAFLIVLVPLGYSKEILDNSLLSKYLLLSSVLILTLSLLYKKLVKDTFVLNYSSALLLCFPLFAILSFLKPINVLEATYGYSKIILLASTFFVARFFLMHNYESSIRNISRFSIIATVLCISFSLGDLVEAFKVRAPLSGTSYLVTGLHGHKNLLSSWLVLLIPLNLLGVTTKSKTLPSLYILLLIVQVSFLALLQTRASLVGIIIGLITFFIFYSVKKKHSLKTLLKVAYYGFIGGFVLVVLCVLFTSLPESFLSGLRVNSSSFQERIVLWQKTINMIKTDPLVGIGGGNWKFLFPNQGVTGLYRAEYNNVIFQRPHNDFLWLWVEYGLLSLLAFYGFIFSGVSASVKKMFLPKAESFLSSAICISGIIAYLTISVFDFPFERIEHQIAFALLMAVLSINDNRFIFKKKQTISTKPFFLLMLLLLSGSLFLGIKRYATEVKIRNILEYKEGGKHHLILREFENMDLSYMNADNNAVPIHWYAGNASFNLQQQHHAIQFYEKALSINPYNFNVLNNAGTGYFVRKDYKRAEELYLEALRINPKFDDVKLNLVAVYINTGQPEKGKNMLGKISVKSSRSEQLRGMLNDY